MLFRSLVPQTVLTGHCPYTYLDIFKVRIAEAGGVVSAEEFDAEGAVLHLTVPDEQVVALQDILSEATRGVSCLEEVKLS